MLEVRVLMTEWMERLGMDTVLRQPAPQPGLHRRREEAQRDPADGAARAAGGRPRRDGLGPRHRRAAGRRPGRARRARGAPRAGRARHHPLHATARGAGARRGAHPDGRAGRAPAAVPELAQRRSRPRATRAGDDAGRRRHDVPRRPSTSRRCARTSRCSSRRGERPPDRLPRLRVVGAAAPAPSSTPWRATTRRRTPTCTAASTPPPRRPPPCTSGPAIVVGRFVGAPDPRRTRWSSPRTRPSRSTWSPSPGAGPTCRPATPCS